MKSSIAVAMSGGVDSSLAAALLKEEGYPLVGITLQLHSCKTSSAQFSCCGGEAISRAQTVCKQLEISHYVLDGSKAFERQILFPAWEEYSQGRTPSPCLLCNEQIKFGFLLQWAQQKGISKIATGHYARIFEPIPGSFELFRGIDPQKDQSYFLAGLTQTQLSSIFFPLGNFTKEEVRKMAKKRGLPTAESKESQDACLVGSKNESFSDLLRERFTMKMKPGTIETQDGKIVGHHDGIHQFTIGQRKGIQIQTLQRTWVKTIDSSRNRIIVTQDENDLFSQKFLAKNIHWISQPPKEGQSLQVQVRYRHVAEPARIEKIQTQEVQVVLQKPVRAITPGQAAVFYEGEKVLGRGWIEKVL